MLRPAAAPPRAERVASSLQPSVVYQQPFFGKRKDLLPSRNLNNRRFHIAANDLQSDPGMLPTAVGRHLSSQYSL